MTTSFHVEAPAPTAIVCPPWCTVPKTEHATELPEWDGVCLHRSEYDDDGWALVSNTTADGKPAPEPGETTVMLMWEDQPVLPKEAEQRALRLLALAREAQR